MKIEYKNYKGKRRIREIEPKALEFGKTPHTREDKWLLVAHDPEDQIEKKFVMENIQRFCPDNRMQRIMCVTTYIINDKNEFLLLFHKKLNQWVPAGGKIENDETPAEAAMRESFEETGLEICLLQTDDTPSNMPSPYGVQLNPIKKGKIDHVDFIYFAKAKNTNIKLDETEATSCKWFSLEEVQKLETFETVKEWCAYFYAIKMQIPG
jgi:8-oxo-dGTP diphosphatase